ncbi:hypothetical protein M409DRAFT_23277 [Zasmidium cellare ATCC 36951]|uniref:Uncharacterized protein n=1 Tax=Zasmidium cellare ATCC 36951 TaxID=1080233 RepID=A0A6A6CMI1_ZASCE|nr:uncharacterized protein M409DRAFT_23277 [Zasmidium cellare ATCC 36951]KAF2166646.1 hypothetical protein M409DRAFT_23277 [Zasmidium cellare ATCC 36951]
MSREEYTPPDLTAKTNNNPSTSTNKRPTTTNASPSSSSTAAVAAPSSPTAPPKPPTTTLRSILDLGIDFSRDDRGGRRLRLNETYDASRPQYYHTSTTREDEWKKVQWECAECTATFRFGPTDYLRCRECGECCAFWKVKDYKR